MSYRKDQERFDAERYAAQKDTMQREDTTRRENTAALSGMTLGILLALAIAAAAGAFFFFNRRIETVPAVPAASPNIAPALPEKETIIREEKTRELVPVPQAATPQPQPSINIIVPNALSPVAPAPKAESAPSNSTPSSNPAKTEAPSPTQ
jgi:hypothetical protein